MARIVIHFFLIVKNYLNGANLLLVLLTVATIANSWLSIESINRQNQIETGVEFRVLDRKPDNYNRFIYFVWHNKSIWQLQSPKILEIGRNYSVKGNSQSYDFSGQTDTFEQSSLSLGVNGFIKISKNFQLVGGCDLICEGLKIVQNSRNYAESMYLSSACKELKYIIRIFAPNSNCQDIFALSYGLVLGGTQKFSRELYGDIRTLGLTHLVAVSGFQVVLVITFLESVALRLNINRKWRLLLIIFGVLALVLIVGPQPPVLRSSVSVLVSLFVLIFLGRRVSSFRALTYSGLILLWLNPFYLNSASFQLSFLASLGLILASTKSNHKTETSLEWLKNYKELSITSLATFLMTLPIIIKLSGQVTFLSVITNIIVLPFIPIVSLLNVIGLVPFVGQLFMILATFLQSLLITFINELSQLPLSNWLAISWESLDWQFFAYYYLFLLILSFWYKKHHEVNNNILKKYA